MALLRKRRRFLRRTLAVISLTLVVLLVLSPLFIVAFEQTTQLSARFVRISDVDAVLGNGEKVPDSDLRLTELVRFKYIRQFTQDIYNSTNKCQTEVVSSQGKFLAGLLNYKRSGFFLEVGAGNGGKDSVSLYFESKLGWTGLLIEPNPLKHSILVKKCRRAKTFNGCINHKPYAAKKILFQGEILDDLLPNTQDPIYRNASVTTCFSLFTVITGLNRHHVDLLILNVKDNQRGIMSCLPFHVINVNLVVMKCGTVSGGCYSHVPYMSHFGFRAIRIINLKSSHGRLQRNYMVFLKNELTLPVPKPTDAVKFQTPLSNSTYDSENQTDSSSKSTASD